jgi:micrococcal nuclease
MRLLYALRAGRARLLCLAVAVAGYAIATPAIGQQAASTAPAKRPAATTGPIQGVVSRITDGDSLWIQPEGKPAIEVRLRDVDAPEICQLYGADAKKALEQFALGKSATLTIAARDAHGRALGTVLIDGQSVAKWMVAEGHAWSVRTRYDRGPLMKEERMAIALKRGLHSTEGAVLPREFRKTNGPCKP